MKLELTYIFECQGGFKVVRNTPEEIISVFNENYNAIKEDAKECNITNINSFVDHTNKYFPKGSISFYLNGEFYRYELRTEVKQLN